jgi:hypothetical protein
MLATATETESLVSIANAVKTEQLWRGPDSVYGAHVVPLRGSGHSIGAPDHPAGGSTYGPRQADWKVGTSEQERSFAMDQSISPNRGWNPAGSGQSYGETCEYGPSAVGGFVADLRAEMKDWTFATRFFFGCVIVASFIWIV